MDKPVRERTTAQRDPPPAAKARPAAAPVAADSGGVKSGFMSSGIPSRGLEISDRILKKAEPVKKTYEDSDSDSMDWDTFMQKDEGVAPAPLPERQPRDFNKLLAGPPPPLPDAAAPS